ncbi:hypothetical protein C8Q77DRAFT_1155922 [Trametes polyzona]|nr:hypothetical protein C8Q77DRAFT_1155922 [Trametes polyzona]
MSAPTCTIVVHSPPTSPILPASPAFTTTLGCLLDSRRSRSPPALFALTPTFAWPAPALDDDQYLQPPTKSMYARGRRGRKAKKSTTTTGTRGRTRPPLETWRSVTDQSTGEVRLVAVQRPDQAAMPSIDAMLSFDLPTSSPADSCHPVIRAEPPTSSPSTLVGLKDPRLVPYMEWASYILLILAHVLPFLQPTCAVDGPSDHPLAAYMGWVWFALYVLAYAVPLFS